MYTVEQIKEMGYKKLTKEEMSSLKDGDSICWIDNKSYYKRNTNND